MAIRIRPEEIPARQTSVSRRRSLFILVLCAGLALVVFLIYVTISSSLGGGQVVMPLDDAYIHFQYAQQIANGQPYVYNPGLPPTSGATSFLYPYVLALGDWLGLRGLNLGLWALGVGAVALAISAWLVYRIVLIAAPYRIALIFAVAFLLDGWVEWHFMSGMETGLAITFTLLTLYAVLSRRFRLSIVAATLLALIRPEGGLLSAIAMLIVLLQGLNDIPVKSRFGIPRLWLWRREWLLLLIPVLAIGVQPLVNWALTGSPVASGNAAKSLFGIIPPDMGIILGRVRDNFFEMWREFATEHFYAFGAAVVGVIALALDKRFRLVAVMLVLWLLAGTAAISTLDTAFWHFKRYQMPLIALFIPLAGWGWALVYRSLLRNLPRLDRRVRLALPVVCAIVIAVSISNLLQSTLQFISNYDLNVGYVVAQPLQMARWLAANTPPDARIAVHDVGMMRYMGGRTTIDIVGLTTPDAASYWRNGPGSIGQFIEKERPDYIASYGIGHGMGLGYLQATQMYGTTLASYTVNLDPNNNVALAAPTDGIYKPDWTAADRAKNVIMLPQVAPYLDGMTLVDSIDVADIDSETAHHYQWRDDRPAQGFPTEFYQFDYFGCAGDACSVMDGGRLIDGEESFTLKTQAGQDLILVTRLHPKDEGTFDVYANDQRVATHVIPALPGSWLEVPTLIPASLVTASTRIRIVPHVSGGYYMPYYQWAYQGKYQPASVSARPLATFESGALQLAAAKLDVDAGTLTTTLDWSTGADLPTGDYKLFIHIVDQSGQNVAQADVRPGQGTLPPGNWLPGSFRDTIKITQIPSGHYQVVMGLYNPDSNQRLQPAGEASADTVDQNQQVVLGEIEVQ